VIRRLWRSRAELSQDDHAHNQPDARQAGGHRWIGADRTDIRANVVDEI
jgi:hypothetical protein